MTSRVLMAVALLAVWLALWGEVSVANVVSGLVVCPLVVALTPGLRTERRHRVHPVAVVRLVGVFLVALVKSTWQVAVTVVRPTPARLRAGVVRVRLRSRSPLTGTIVADLVTLTPGTVTLSLVDGVIYVHVLGLTDPDAARADVLAFERAVLAAVEPLGEWTPWTGSEVTT